MPGTNENRPHNGGRFKSFNARVLPSMTTGDKYRGQDSDERDCVDHHCVILS